MIDLSRPVADIVGDHPETARVMQRHRIDYCCRGQMPLAAACADRGADPEVVRAELDTAIAERRGVRDGDPRTLGTAALIALVVDRHHGYLRRQLPFLVPLAKKVARVHGEHDPRLIELLEIVTALSDALLPHLDEEEKVLFPALLGSRPDVALGTELDAMKSEHLAVGDLLHRMRVLTADFAVPDWACGSYRTLFAELEDLEGDVLAHVHLENHVLAPRALAGAAE